jgi:hypothetical protein
MVVYKDVKSLIGDWMESVSFSGLMGEHKIDIEGLFTLSSGYVILVLDLSDHFSFFAIGSGGVSRKLVVVKEDMRGFLHLGIELESMLNDLISELENKIER